MSDEASQLRLLLKQSQDDLYAALVPKDETQAHSIKDLILNGKRIFMDAWNLTKGILCPLHKRWGDLLGKGAELSIVIVELLEAKGFAQNIPVLHFAVLVSIIGLDSLCGS
jgi:hypothetical protein